ncbi:hypothetical protein [Actinoplanes derwentensis]|uniref:hypothetical protein n=1 Tax=Actinoplanes derwentensis TaxID=113562 RepID=UPI0012FD7A19|nr:hypothetical protein [Actinoplanes derwentensis]
MSGLAGYWAAGSPPAQIPASCPLITDVVLRILAPGATLTPSDDLTDPHHGSRQCDADLASAATGIRGHLTLRIQTTGYGYDASWRTRQCSKIHATMSTTKPDDHRCSRALPSIKGVARVAALAWINDTWEVKIDYSVAGPDPLPEYAEYAVQHLLSTTVGALPR